METRTFAFEADDATTVLRPDLAYPYRDQIVPNYAATGLSIGVPAATILLMQFRIRSFHDTRNAITGLLSALLFSVLFHFMLKWVVSGLRPHFLDVCKPDLAQASNITTLDGSGHRSMMWTSDICTAEDTLVLNESMASFPSGHATASFAGFVYLSLYLNAKLKVFANYFPTLWKLSLVYGPVLLATLIAGTLTVDGSHHGIDVVAGAILGTALAFSSYRSVYASIWDWRMNHVPLHYAPLLESDGVTPLEHVRPDFTATHRRGWGRPKGPAEAVEGALNRATKPLDVETGGRDQFTPIARPAEAVLASESKDSRRPGTLSVGNGVV